MVRSIHDSSGSIWIDLVRRTGLSEQVFCQYDYRLLCLWHPIMVKKLRLDG